MSFEQLEHTLIDFGNSPPAKIAGGQAKARLIKQLFDSLHMRTEHLVRNVGYAEDPNQVLANVISALAQATNRVGDLLTKEK